MKIYEIWLICLDRNSASFETPTAPASLSSSFSTSKKSWKWWTFGLRHCGHDRDLQKKFNWIRKALDIIRKLYVLKAVVRQGFWWKRWPQFVTWMTSSLRLKALKQIVHWTDMIINIENKTKFKHKRQVGNAYTKRRMNFSFEKV